MKLSSITESLDIFKCEEMDGCVQITVPLALNMTFNFLTLYIRVNEDGFTVFDEGSVCDEHNDTEQGYLDVFLKKYPEHDYGIRVQDRFFYKDYPNDYNPRMAIDDFIRFFVPFDDFVCTWLGDDIDTGGDE